MTNEYNPIEITDIVRKQARIYLPLFDSEAWYCEEDHTVPQVFKVKRSPTKGEHYGHYDFILDMPKQSSYGGIIIVSPNFRGKGIGRRLVEMREYVCRTVGVKYVFIQNNDNSSFWNHFGYEPTNKKTLNERCSLSDKLRCKQPMLKILDNLEVIEE